MQRREIQTNDGQLTRATGISRLHFCRSSNTHIIYFLGFTLGPLVIAPLSELYGRLYIYHACNVIFLAFISALSPHSDHAHGPIH